MEIILTSDKIEAWLKIFWALIPFQHWASFLFGRLVHTSVLYTFEGQPGNE